MKSFIGKHKKLVIYLALTVSVIAGAFLVISQMTAQSKNQEAANLSQKTAQIEKRTLVESVSATGKVISLAQKNVAADVTGVKVQSVHVKVGDMVAQGDELCVLDSSDIETKLADARASLNVTKEKAQVDVSSATRSLAEAEITRNVSVERANTDVVDAANDYLKAVKDLEEAEAEWDAAKDEIEKRDEEYENCKEQTQKAKEELPSVSSGNPDYQMTQTKYQELQQQESEALNKYNTAKQNETSCESAYNQALSTVESKLDAYNQKVRSQEDTVQNNDSTVKNKEDSLKTSNLNASVSGISDKEQIRQYEKQIESCRVTAPIGGIVTAVSVDEGDTYGGGTIVTIEDVSAYEITAEIEEYDIAVINVGQKAVIKTNGTGDLELSGVVTKIAPRATTGSSNVTYTVTISPDTFCDKLKMDMTAKLSIILESKENVLTVPYDFVQEDAEGRCYIEVLDVQTKKIFITKGIESDYYVEITGKGIREGMSVVAPATQKEDSNAGNAMRGRGPMGGF